MKILHLCLGTTFADNYSYQENILPKYHRALGHDVAIIASLFTFTETGDNFFYPEGHSYLNEYGIKVHRLNYLRFARPVQKMLRRYCDTYACIEQEKPDIIFIHGCQFLDIKQVVKYVKKHPEVEVYVDNHADFLNSAKNWLSKNILHKIVWRHCAKLIEPYTRIFWGVLPARVDFLVDVYDLPRDKVKLLVMGADDEKVAVAKNEDLRKSIREQYGIKDNDFLIMTGGKIDRNKPQTLLLMEAVKRIGREDVKLLVFGSVYPDYKEKIRELCCDSVQYIGWVDSKETYKYFNAADLVVFPGLHSVFWEQVVGLGKPCVFRYMDGFNHVDLNGNCRFLYEDSVEEMEKIIREICNDRSLYEQMSNVALKEGMNLFSYKKIAQRSIANLVC